MVGMHMTAAVKLDVDDIAGPGMHTLNLFSDVTYSAQLYHPFALRCLVGLISGRLNLKDLVWIHIYISFKPSPWPFQNICRQ